MSSGNPDSDLTVNSFDNERLSTAMDTLCLHSKTSESEASKREII